MAETSRGKKAWQTRERNKAKRRQEAEEAQAARFLELMKAGRVPEYVSYSEGWRIGKTKFDRSVIDLLVRRELIKRGSGRNLETYRLSSPEEYAAEREAKNRQLEQNRRQWLDYWKQRLATEDQENVISELVSWGGYASLTDEFKP